MTQTEMVLRGLLTHLLLERIRLATGDAALREAARHFLAEAKTASAVTLGSYEDALLRLLTDVGRQHNTRGNDD